MILLSILFFIFITKQFVFPFSSEQDILVHQLNSNYDKTYVFLIGPRVCVEFNFTSGHPPDVLNGRSKFIFLTMIWINFGGC